MYEVIVYSKRNFNDFIVKDEDIPGTVVYATQNEEYSIAVKEINLK